LNLTPDDARKPAAEAFGSAHGLHGGGDPQSRLIPTLWTNLLSTVFTVHGRKTLVLNVEAKLSDLKPVMAEPGGRKARPYSGLY
jgi:hypothetical protein